MMVGVTIGSGGLQSTVGASENIRDASRGKPIFTSGGSSGSSSSPKPKPKTPAQLVSEQAKNIKKLRAEAKSKGVSPDVLARQKAITFQRQLIGRIRQIKKAQASGKTLIKKPLTNSEISQIARKQLAISRAGREAFYAGEEQRKEQQRLQSNKEKLAEMTKTLTKKPSSNKLALTQAFERVAFDLGILNEKKYKAWEKKTLEKADKWEKSEYGKKFKQVDKDIKTAYYDLFINLPIALVNLGKRTGISVYNTTKNPDKLYKNTLSKIKTAQNILIDQYKKNNSPQKAWNNAKIKYANVISKNDKLSKKQKEKFVRGMKNDFNDLSTLKTFRKTLNSLVRLKPKDVRDFSKTAGTSFVKYSYIGLTQLPGGLVQLVNDPSLIKTIPANIKADTKDTLELLKTNPAEGIGKIGATYFTYRVVGGALKFTGKITGKVSRRLNPYWKSFSKGKIVIKNPPKEIFTRKGKSVYLKKRVTNTSIVNKVKAKVVKKIPIKAIAKRIKVRKAGQFKKFQKTKGITIRKGLLTDNARKLSEQLKQAGTKGTIVTAQADRLLSFFRRNKIIRKPLPNEANLTALTKRLLKKFDDGKITNREFYKLNKLVLNQTGKTMLERSLFADPNGLVRFTRLGGEVGEASLRDILSGNFTLKKQRPQVIVFPEGKISKLPKSLKDIYKKLKADKKLTANERARLVKWQVKSKSPNWKPIGDTEYRGGIESEVTLAPNQTIRRVKKLATTEINGVGVDIVEAKVITLPKKITNLVKKAERGKINKIEVKELRKLLKKKGIKTTERKIKNLKKPIRYKPKPRLPLRRKASARFISRVAKTGRSARKVKRTRTPISKLRIRKSVSIQTKSPRNRKTTRVPRVTVTPSKTPSKRIRGVRGSRTPRKKTKKKILFGKSKIKRSEKSKPQPVFNVFGKSGKKFVKLNTKPLTRKDALNRGAFAIDNTTSRTFKIKPAGKSKTSGTLRKNEKNYFNRSGYKLREVRVRGGRKFALKNKYIERTKSAIDTTGEKKGLTIAKLLRKERGGVRKKSTRKKSITPSQRKVMLRNLAKARRIKKLKGGYK